MDTKKPDLRGILTSAKDTAEQIYDFTSCVPALVKIANAQTRAGYPDDAKKSLESALQKFSKGDSLFSDIASAQAKAGYLAEAMETANRIDLPEKKAEALLSIAEAMAGQGHEK